MSYSPLLNSDIEGGWDSKYSANFEFAEKQVRLGFVRKVFGILTLQLALTVGVAAAFIYSAPAKNYIYAHPWPFWTAFGVSFALILVLGFWEQARRSHPWNLILLFLFTACESLLVGTVSAAFDTKVVLLAAGMTAGVVLGLTLFTLQTKLDLTPSVGALCGLTWTLIWALILQIFIRAHWLHLTICIVGVCLFSVYLVVDVQLVMGGQRYSISPDEYVFASLNLYLDIINIFLYILQLVHEFTRNS